MSQIIAVSKSGKNVLTATDPNDFIFHSSYNTFKIIATGTYAFTMPRDAMSERLTTILTHGLSYTPFAFVFLKWDSEDKVGVAGEPAPFFMNDNWFSNVYIDSTKIYVGTVNNTADINVTVKYYICEVPF